MKKLARVDEPWQLYLRRWMVVNLVDTLTAQSVAEARAR